MRARNRIITCFTIAVSIVGASRAFAAAVTLTDPVGAMTISVPSGQTRMIALPLLHSVAGSGVTSGAISSVGPDYIDVLNANWIPGAYSDAANPFLLRITSGSAAGRVIPVSSVSNSATRIMLANDGMPLDQVLSPMAGDRYELVLGDTLASFFGSAILQGGADVQSADVVQIWGGTAWVAYYFNSARNRWERSTDSSTSASRDNTLLRQDRGFSITRRASVPLKMVVTGRVPNVAPIYHHLMPGITLLSHGSPVGLSLGALAFQTRISGWRGAASATAALSDADLVQVWGGASWNYFYFDTTKNCWQRTLDGAASPSRDGIKLSAGQSFMIRRIGAAANQEERFITMPLLLGL